jgi:hypothetical protein
MINTKVKKLKKKREKATKKMSHYGIQIKGTSPILDKKPRPLSSQSPFLSVHAEGGRIEFNKGGRIGLKEGGDSKWIQKATKNMRTDKPCTGKKFGSKTCPPGSKRYNLAKTFKKMARNA